MTSLSPVLACVTTSAESTTGEAPMTLLSPVPACVCDFVLYGVLVRVSVHVCVCMCCCMHFLMFVSAFFYVRSCVCLCGCMRVCVHAFLRVCMCVCHAFLCAFVRVRVLLYVWFLDCQLFVLYVVLVRFVPGGRFIRSQGLVVSFFVFVSAFMST